MTGVVALLLAAGAGRRMGRPKALVAGADGTPWVVSAVRTLRDGGCTDVLAVAGAERDRAGYDVSAFWARHDEKAPLRLV